MTNRHGDFIWYELMTRDPDRAKAFYDAVAGWTIATEPFGSEDIGGMDYRMVEAPDTAVGGVFRLSDAMCAEGARPGWLGYVAVENVDETVARAEALGGKTLMPAYDIPEVGRIALIADPQGAAIYVMRGTSADGTSTAFDETALGHCRWNELTTSDPAAALAFYGDLFGWTSTEKMAMGEAGDYAFLDHGDTRLGAVTPFMGGSPVPVWTYYFRVADIDASIAATEKGGGKILHGPMEVPGGEHIVIGMDPEGVAFALVGDRPNA